jgi:hypothetical protein
MATNEVEIMARLAGAWDLVAIELPQADGTTKRSDAAGLLIFSAEGHMAVQVRNLEAAASDSVYSSGGYEASYGSIAIDPATSTFVYQVEGALIHDLVGQKLPRAFQLMDDQLVLTSARTDETWRVLWCRAQRV